MIRKSRLNIFRPFCTIEISRKLCFAYGLTQEWNSFPNHTANLNALFSIAKERAMSHKTFLSNLIGGIFM